MCFWSSAVRITVDRAYNWSHQFYAAFSNVNAAQSSVLHFLKFGKCVPSFPIIFGLQSMKFDVVTFSASNELSSVFLISFFLSVWSFRDYFSFYCTTGKVSGTELSCSLFSSRS